MGEGYDDKRTFRCVCCGVDVIATKFASAKTIKCEECKKNKAEVNQDILDEILAEASAKSMSKRSTSDIVDGKKRATCVNCGKEIWIGKFASAKTCLCGECKGEDEEADDIDTDGGIPKIDLSKIDKSLLPSLDQAYVMPYIISNHRLRQVTCPACGHEFMKIIKIVDANEQRGLVIMYQCYKCMTGITLSEQCITKMQPSPQHVFFNYRGEEIHNLVGTTSDTRIRNSIEMLLKLCKDNNIDIHGVNIPDNVVDILDKNVNTGIDKNWENEHLTDSFIISSIEDKCGVIPGRDTNEKIQNIINMINKKEDK